MAMFTGKIVDTKVKPPADEEFDDVGWFDESDGVPCEAVYALYHGTLWGPFEFEIEAIGWLTQRLTGERTNR